MLDGVRHPHGHAAALLALLVLLAGCATAGRHQEPTQAMLGRDHPLADRIWDVAAGRPIDRQTLVARLGAARFILLGEKHDNPDHHRWQASLVGALAAAGRRPAVAFEMFTTDDAPAIARHLTASPTDAAGLADAVNWKESGWPDWALYQPIAEAALGAGLAIVAANLPPAAARAMGRSDLAALDPGLVERYRLDRPPAPEVREAMAEEIRESHCGYAPERMLDGMIAAQRARDAQMAESLAAGQRDGAVLIAGLGHVRTDWGVPAYLRIRLPEATVASLAFTEVHDGHPHPADYARDYPDRRLPFDYVWFTPRVDDEDPCEKFRKSLERLRKPRRDP